MLTALDRTRVRAGLPGFTGEKNFLRLNGCRTVQPSVHSLTKEAGSASTECADGRPQPYRKKNRPAKFEQQYGDDRPPRDSGLGKKHEPAVESAPDGRGSSRREIMEQPQALADQGIVAHPVVPVFVVI